MKRIIDMFDTKKLKALEFDLLKATIILNRFQKASEKYFKKHNIDLNGLEEYLALKQLQNEDHDCKAGQDHGCDHPSHVKEEII